MAIASRCSCRSGTPAAPVAILKRELCFQHESWRGRSGRRLHRSEADSNWFGPLAQTLRVHQLVWLALARPALAPNAAAVKLPSASFEFGCLHVGGLLVLRLRLRLRMPDVALLEQGREQRLRRRSDARRRAVAIERLKTRVRPDAPWLELGSMLRIHVGLALAAMQACHSPMDDDPSKSPVWKSEQNRPPRAVGQAEDSQPRAMAQEAAQVEATWRLSMQSEGDRVTEALELVTHLESEERHEDALHVLSQVDAKQSCTAVDVAIASLLRDVGRRREALDRLCHARARDPSAFGPGLIFEMAELAWSCGDFEAASAALASLRETIEGDAFEKLHPVALAELRAGVARRSSPRTRKVRDLLGDLRGSADADSRLRTLRLLLEQQDDVGEKACMIAVGDADARLRTIGVLRAVVPTGSLPEFCAVALSDADASVRAAGARRADGLSAAERVPLLLPALAAESSAATFAEIDARLCAAMGSGIAAEPAQAEDAGFRRQVVADRRRVFER